MLKFVVGGTFGEHSPFTKTTLTAPEKEINKKSN